MNRTFMVVGNWKMNKNFLEGLLLTNEVLTQMGTVSGVQVVLAPPFIELHTIGNMMKDQAAFCRLGAQNCHSEAKGAFTGEISVEMLKSVGVEYVIIGHSERRQHFGENNKFLAKKVSTVIEHGLKPIFCCGEPLEIRERNEQEKYVEQQLEESLFHLSDEQFKQVVIAYEPVWAIGTGKTATPQQAQEMHRFVRDLIGICYTSTLANATPILYGGSCNALNAAELFAQNDVDGGLIGGASLKAYEFVQIVKAATQRPMKK